MALLQTELKKLLGRTGDIEKAIRELKVLEFPNPYNYQGDINPVVNGNMSVHQRVNAVTIPVGGAAVYTLDQWKAQNNGTGHVINVSQQAMPLNETAFALAGEYTPTNFLRWAQTTAGTGTTLVNLFNPIEDARLYAGLPVTLSFWARSSVSSYVFIILTQNATGGQNSPLTAYTLTPNWKKYSIQTTLGNTITATPAGSYLGVRFSPDGNTVQNLDITSVQLDRGSVAANFKYESFETTLRRCQRFFAKSNAQGIAPGNILFANRAGSFEWQNWTAVVANRAAGTVFLPAVMRVAPTVTFYNPDVAANAFARDMGAALNATTTTTDRIGDRSFNVTYTQNAASAASAFYAVHWTASAEI